MSMAARILGMVVRGTLTRVAAAAGKVPQLTAQLLADDEAPGIDQSGWYGFATRPKAGAQCVVVAVGGDSDNLVAISVDDVRYRIALEDGECALYDDLGQRVHLTRSGIVVDADSIALGAGATRRVARMEDSVQITDPQHAAWVSWVTSALTGLVGPPTPAQGPVVQPTGVITSGSARVKAD